ncbi:Initiator Replication protein [Methylomagnum ishizawai]|uniref:Initiator Replication protein n=1 Tax=Methylomagnum ishizawai TaxID=1760988 RepID=A0A1Y6D4C9_9GAMM|nr:replication initiation protein [Methylomagnum ishizawai]SMF97749.1 Initiator Replication protein [Methylomagnum ishizawai]SMF97809.1 Initiator Replication protein [Methylomagnum ishizawai]
MPAVIVNIQGPYTERDRKLYAFLVHAVWDELGVKRIHELPVARINKVFEEHHSDTSQGWIWESAKRLAMTSVEWAQVEGEDRLHGIAHLFSYAATHEAARADGVLKFEFPAGLIPVLKEPRRFARLRIHFLIALSGKYAVTLYEILESVANLRNPVLEIELTKLRQWLKVPEDKLDRYVDLKRFVLEPGIRQINMNPEGAGFSAQMEALKSGKAVERIRFVIQKLDTRVALEKQIKPRLEPPVPPPVEPMSAFGILLSTRTYEKAKQAAPDFDIYGLEAEWRDWIKGKPRPNDPDAAFVGFCRKRQRRMEVG